MGVQNVGDKLRRKCERILGLAIIRTHTMDKHGVLKCWVSKHEAAIVDHTRGVIVEQVSHQGSLVAYCGLDR